MSKIDPSNTVDFNLDFDGSEVFGVNQIVKGVLTIIAHANQVIDKIGYKFILETKGVYKTDQYVVFDQPLSNATVLKKGNTYSFNIACLVYTSPSPRDATLSRMPSSA